MKTQLDISEAPDGGGIEQKGVSTIRKAGISAAVLLALAACGNENTNENDNGTGNDGVEDLPSAETVVDEAAALYEEIDGFYVERETVHEREEDMEDMNGVQSAEGMPEGGTDLMIEERVWMIEEDGEVWERLEVQDTIYGEEDGEPVEIEGPEAVRFTDQEDPAYQISYNRGEAEASRGEPFAQGDVASEADTYDRLLDEADLTLDGEEEINGVDTYRIDVEEEDLVSTYWFDADTFFEVKRESAEEEGGTGMGGDPGSREVLDYDLDPAWEEDLFEPPEDVEVIEEEDALDD
ncbi:hypothetical protein [Alkalicoccus chagannorensis]|uniref:hypothetical protein n=1 Tax=Alkalicoccus chagannorensis TaxID=427072 RepID=UPI000429981B|nr:hypothetical protein [Alkalicoccus chagannorensis]